MDHGAVPKAAELDALPADLRTDVLDLDHDLAGLFGGHTTDCVPALRTTEVGVGRPLGWFELAAGGATIDLGPAIEYDRIHGGSHRDQKRYTQRCREDTVLH